MKKISILLVCACFISSCYVQEKNKKIETLVNKAYKAILKKDTSNLYLIIDTEFCFEMYGKEDFLHKISFASNILNQSKEAFRFNKRNLQYNAYLNIYQYNINIPFGSTVEGDKLILSFSNEDSFDHIKMIDFIFKDKTDVLPLEPINKISQ